MWPGLLSGPKLPDGGPLGMIQPETRPMHKLGPPFGLWLCRKWLLPGLNTKHGIMAGSAHHEDHIARGLGGIIACTKRLSRHSMNYNVECFLRWIQGGPEGTEMQLCEDGRGQMDGVPHSECSHHHTGVSLYLLLLSSLSLLLSGVPELPRLHSLEPD